MELAGRAWAGLLARVAVDVSRHTARRTLLRITLPAGRTPRVIGVNDFASGGVTTMPPARVHPEPEAGP